jgi:hypothetical protein
VQVRKVPLAQPVQLDYQELQEVTDYQELRELTDCQELLAESDLEV